MEKVKQLKLWKLFLERRFKNQDEDSDGADMLIYDYFKHMSLNYELYQELEAVTRLFGRF